LAEGVGGVEGVGGGGGGRDRDTGAASGTDLWRDDDVGCAGDLSGKSNSGAGRNGRGRGGKARDGGARAGGDVRAGVERRDLDDVEIGSGDGAELVEVGVVPSRVRCTGDIHGRAVVGEDEAVFFHGVEDDLIGGGESGDIEAGFEAKTRAHRQSGGVARGGGPVGSWRSEPGAGILQCETNRVMDGAGGDFVVADESREDGEPGGVGAGPGVGALLVSEKIPDGAGGCVPGRSLRVGTVEFVEQAAGVVENEDVTIAGAGIGVAFDGNGEGDGHEAGIGFAVGGVVDGNGRLRGIDYGVGNTHARAVVEAGAEIRMKADGRADARDDGGGVGVDRRRRDVFVSEIV
jgi:hypothetical protein